MARKVDQYLEQLLQLHWLRPETALWRSFDCLLAEQYAGLGGAAVDLGCGDGLLSYVMAGGRVADYDVFVDVADVGDYRTGADIYNSIPAQQPRLDNSHLRHRYSFGIDHKDGLIAKAKRLAGFYEKTMVSDLNDPLPFDDGSFDAAFSNILYWLDDLDAVLSEWHRILRSGGRLILFVPNENFKAKSWLYYEAPHQGQRRYLNFLDRGYGQLIRHCYCSQRWSELFHAHGFEVRHHQPYLTDAVMEIWNVGTRPIAPLLIDMATRLTAQDRAHCKTEWVKYFQNFFAPIVEGELLANRSEQDCAFHFYVLEKCR